MSFAVQRPSTYKRFINNMEEKMSDPDSCVIFKILFVRTKNIIHNWGMDLFWEKCLNGCINRIIAVREERAYGYEAYKSQ